METKDLEEKIAERLGLIKRIVSFIEKMTRELGTSRYHEGSCHTNIVRQLDGFRNFSFLANTCHNMMGGNTFYIWYHPGKKEIDKKNTEPVFYFYYQNDIETEGEVIVFDKNGEWQYALIRMIERQDKIIAEAKKQKEGEEKRQLLQEENERKRAKLLETAKKLKL